MARTLITPVSLIRDIESNITTPTTIDGALVTAGVKIPYDRDNNAAEKLLIHVKNTHGSIHTVTIVKSDVGSRKNLGNVDVTVAATDGEQILRPSTNRNGQSNGFVYLNFTTAMTGSIIAYLMP